MANEARAAFDTAKSSFYANNLPKANAAYQSSVASRDEAISQIRAKEDEFQAYGAQVSAARGELEGAKAQRQAMWESAWSDQKSRIETMKQVLGQLAVKEGGR
jgi:hypothetical protein